MDVLVGGVRFRVHGSGFTVQGSRFGVHGLGFCLIIVAQALLRLSPFSFNEENISDN